MLETSTESKSQEYMIRARLNKLKVTISCEYKIQFKAAREDTVELHIDFQRIVPV